MKITVWSFGIRSQGLGFLSICGPGMCFGKGFNWDQFEKPSCGVF